MDPHDGNDPAVGGTPDLQAFGLEPRSRAAEAEVEQRLDTSSTTIAPLVGDGARSREPRGAPCFAPAAAGLEGCQCVEPVAGLQQEWAGPAVDRRQDPLVQLTLDPPLGELAIVVHDSTLAPPRGARHDGSGAGHGASPRPVVVRRG